MTRPGLEPSFFTFGISTVATSSSICVLELVATVLMALITLMEGASESWGLITKEKYTMILTVMIRLHTGERSIYPQIYKWCSYYAPVASGETFILVARPDDVIGFAIVDKTVEMDTVKRIIYFKAAY
jgi:hypothetical protein